MKTIGVLGGIGPQSTMALVARIHARSQQVIPQRLNEGYPPLQVTYLRHPPVRFGADGRPVQPLELDARVLAAAELLGRSCDFLVVGSNTTSLFAAEIETAAGVPVVRIADVVVDELKRRQLDHVGLLGLGVPETYTRRFVDEGIRFELVDAALRERVDDAVFRLMEGAATDDHLEACLAALTELRKRAPVTVLGCTEIPILLGARARSEDIVNPGELLADEAVRRAITTARKCASA